MELKFSIIALVAVLAAAGCAPTFSRQALGQVDRSVTFRQLQENPDRYRGKTVMAGGVILETRNTAEGTYIEVLERPLDRQAKPRETDDTEGRFIISTPQYLDAAVYHNGKRISMIGEVSGSEVRPLGGIHYRYPVLAAKELRTWDPEAGPRVSFGFGIGVYHHF